MAEYIERNAIKYEQWPVGPLYEPIMVVRKKTIDNIPSANVAQVRHGKWEWSKDYDGDSILVCSECGRVCHEEDAPYCYCGAKMDGGDTNA